MRVHQQVVAIVLSMVAVGGEVWGGNRKTKNGKKNPTTAPTEVPEMDGGCYVDFQFSITNKLDVALYAISSITSHGYLYMPRGSGCNDCKYDKQCTYNNCMNIPPGGTQYFKTKKSSPCQGVEGTFIYGPSNAAYTAQTGLNTIELNFKDGGGPNGKIIATQQLNTPNPKGYKFGQNIPRSSCSNSQHCVENFTVDVKPPATPVANNVTEYNGSWASIASGGTVGISAGTSWSKEQSSTIGTSFEKGFTEEVSTKFGKTTKVTAGASQVMGETSSSTISQSNSGSYGVTCTSNECNGRLYQWQTAAEYSNGPTQIVKSCFFKCVPLSTPNGPLCPYGFCASESCQCCNAVWMKDNSTPTANHLTLSAGGTCKTCKANNVACSNDEECCTGTCNKGGLLPTGGTCA